MTVDTYWRRADPDAIADLEPLQLRELVPYYSDGRFRAEVDARITVLAEDCGTLMCELLRLGAGGDVDDDHAAWLAVEGADGLDSEEMIGVLAPAEVAKVAEFLYRVDPVAWTDRFRPHLEYCARALGYGYPFDDAWAQALVTATHEVTELFALAAKTEQAVIVMVVV